MAEGEAAPGREAEAEYAVVENAPAHERRPKKRLRVLDDGGTPATASSGWNWTWSTFKGAGTRSDWQQTWTAKGQKRPIFEAADPGLEGAVKSPSARGGQAWHQNGTGRLRVPQGRTAA